MMRDEDMKEECEQDMVDKSCDETFAHEDGKVRITVFDLDGTVLDGQSPVTMVYQLYKDGALSFRHAFSLVLWGFRYKVGLPHNEVLARTRIFKAFKGMPVDEADEIMGHIYNKKVSPKLRSDALKKIRWHRDRGDVVLLVSASFEPITLLAAKDTGASGQSSTRMAVEDGAYTGDIDGSPVEGEEKVKRLKEYADERFGKGAWFVDYSYGDHDSDAFILSLARHPVAVNPKRKLKDMAEDSGWAIEEWE